MFHILLRVSCLLVLALIFAPPAAAQTQTTLTLTGEELASGPSSTATMTCGTSTHITFHAEGVAAGPYPGTFVEDGSVTFEDGVVTHFHAEFQIDSAGTTITGTKDLDPAGPTSTGSCRPAAPFDDFGEVTVFSRYTAQIDGPLEDSTESGTAATSITASNDAAGQTTLQLLAESFQSGGPPGMTIELAPLTSIGPTGTSHTVTAVVRQAGDPVQGITVLFVVTSPTGSTSRCETDANGICSFTYPGPEDPQADDIRACADTNLNGQQDPGLEPCADASRIWTRNANSPGRVTGGGYIREFRVNFAVHAKAQTITDPADGGCNVNDHLQNVRIRCISVTNVVIFPTRAIITGQAEQDGVATNYEIQVDDLDSLDLEDTFEITTGLGYTTGGPLTGGNIHINF